MLRRIVYFLGLNLVLVLTFGAIVQFLPIPKGSNLYFIVFYALIGFGSAFVSLLMSKRSAKWSMRVQTIDPKTAQGLEKWLLDSVHELSRKAGLPKMPEVGIFPARELNAFATGPSKSNSLVAVSEGLLQGMTEDEIEGVLAHEVAHIKNGDMVTMVLLQGAINTLVMFVARILSDLVYSAISRDNRGGFFMRYILFQVFAGLLGYLGLIVSGSFSRKREYRADHGAARLVGSQKMISALQRLQSAYPAQNNPQQNKQQEAMAALQISGRFKKSKLAQLISTHPPLDQRISALKRRAL